MAGKLIAFEGIDGSGLSTQAKLLHDHLRTVGHRRAYLTKEPTDGPIGVQLRLALRGRLALESAVMALCFAADRLDHLATDIVPRLKDGFQVISDRYALSSLAYQSVDLDLAWLQALNSRCRPADLTVFLDVPVEVSMARLKTDRWRQELFETTEQLQRTRQNYLALIPRLQEAGENIVVVPGVVAGQERSIEDVASDVRAAWSRLVGAGG